MFRGNKLEFLLHLLGDALAVFLCFLAAFWVQFDSGWIADKFNPAKLFSEYTRVAIASTCGWILLFAITGLYRSWLLLSRTLQVLYVARAAVLGTLAILLGLFGFEFIGRVTTGSPLLGDYIYGSRFRWILLYGFAIFFLVATFRMGIALFLRALLRKGYGANKILILGATEAGEKIAKAFSRAPERGRKVVGFLDEHFSVMAHEFAGFPVLGKYSDLASIVKKNKISGIVISHDSSSLQEITRVLAWACDLPLHIYVIPGLYNVISGHYRTNLVHGFELQELFAFTMPPWQVQVKRLMDIIVAAILLLGTLPIMLFAAIAIKLDSKGPVFYSQERVGLYGKRFMVRKFRTMRTDAEKNGAQWATKNDPRITRVGRFLRKTRIDELPQLLSVLKGEMSMVGPRPERAVFIEKLREQIPFYIGRLKMKPGLTGWAQVRYHYDTSLEDVQKKLEYDMYYYENMSLLLDLQILFRTIYVVLTGKGAQ
ncbi:MAG: sugar transferase [Hallerella porci]|uniref:sugar transferase n=1 Tax=Hallerella TaxID=2815788 RepID=UPI000D0834AF|nr:MULTISPECIES: sugar transferase [Hallerella]MCI5601296.1 sugar transferase [Hallerella sp.]MDY3921303.1 sugar transferase [Hallerella porci]